MNVLVLFIASFLLFNCVPKSQQIQSNLQPNILLINIDDMGWRDVGFMGSQYYETPNIDALAADGMIFTNAYAAAANCAPSRSCMMSGQWTQRHGVYTVNNSDRGKSSTRKIIPTENTWHLDESQYILTEALKDAGYTTCHAGKWHITKDPLKSGIDVKLIYDAVGSIFLNRKKMKACEQAGIDIQEFDPIVTGFFDTRSDS